MQRVLLLGAGKIGRMVANFLAGSGDYEVLVGDTDVPSLERLRKLAGVDTAVIDGGNFDHLVAAMRDRPIVISALSYLHNPVVAEAALHAGSSYFDLTEDINTTSRVIETAAQAREGQIFMPQCGLAPGFVSIVANNLTQAFESLDRVYMRVGALPQFPSNALKYNLTWSTDGLINEYCNPCEAIHEGQRINVLAARGRRALFARRRPLRSLQHLRRPGHALRHARRPRPRAQLQDHPLPGPSRPDDLPGQRPPPGRAPARAQGHPRKRRARHLPGRRRHLLHRLRLAKRPVRADQRRPQDLRRTRSKANCGARSR